MTNLIETNSFLNAEAVNALNLPVEQRIEYIRSSRWIGYPKAIEIIGKLEDLLVYPKKHRMPNLLIIGDSNSGKTMIADRFTALNKAYENEDGQSIVVPVLSIQSPCSGIVNLAT
ncbi:TniB family NTP-binding protein [Shewanella sp. SM34]|uniref:TniB family NTP-binding protein n=1 Tax=unclassified Shewanella TaxID=196818 RepID=UPI0021DA0D97|nr:MULTISPECIES: TniB family NTP-binding protein [unclassified Shewanella]MCU8058775.1 TniB family NTP-binding protein [Shewanella sp. SM35]MCU8067706.1 TniB family NTP-binding protein [Shewanella sp. SM34]